MPSLGVDRRGDVNRALGRAIAQARDNVTPKPTQNDMARHLDMTARNYRKIESGEVRCPLDVLLPIAHLLNTEAWVLTKIAENQVAREDPDDDGPEPTMRATLGLK